MEAFILFVGNDNYLFKRGNNYILNERIYIYGQELF